MRGAWGVARVFGGATWLWSGRLATVGSIGRCDPGRQGPQGPSRWVGPKANCGLLIASYTVCTAIPSGRHPSAHPVGETPGRGSFPAVAKQNAVAWVPSTHPTDRRVRALDARQPIPDRPSGPGLAYILARDAALCLRPTPAPIQCYMAIGPFLSEGFRWKKNFSIALKPSSSVSSN